MNNQLLLSYSTKDDIKALFELIGLIAYADKVVVESELTILHKFITRRFLQRSNVMRWSVSVTGSLFRKHEA
jgi:hypothetical protein